MSTGADRPSPEPVESATDEEVLASAARAAACWKGALDLLAEAEAAEGEEAASPGTVPVWGIEQHTDEPFRAGGACRPRGPRGHH